MKTEHEITALLTRTADERPVDVEALWARTHERLREPVVRRPRPVARRRASVIGAVAATAVIAGSAVVVRSLVDDRASGSEGPSSATSGTPKLRTSLADDVLRLHPVRLPAYQRHIEATVVDGGQHSERYSGPTLGLGPVTVGGEAGVVVLASGQYQQSGVPFARFVSAIFVRHHQSADAAIRTPEQELAIDPVPLAPDQSDPDYRWSYDDSSRERAFADRLVLTSATGPEVRRWVVRFTDGSSVAAQRFTVPGSGDAFFLLVGPHLSDVWGRLKDVSWYGAGGTLLHRSDGGGDLP